MNAQLTRSPADAVPPRDLDALLRFVRTTTLCDARQGREFASAIQSVGRHLDRPLASIPTEPSQLRRHLAALRAREGELSKRRVTNIRSLVKGAAAIAGVIATNRPVAEALREPWRALFERLQDRYLRTSLAPFARFCSANGTDPHDVSDDIADAYLRHLQQTSLVKKPQTVHQTVCRTWNQAGVTVPGWPAATLAVPTYATGYTLPLTAFPVSFQQELEAHLRRLGAAEIADLLDELAPARPLRASSIRTKRYQVRQFASALVLSGVLIEHIDQLAVLTTIDNFKRGLNFFIKRIRTHPNNNRTAGQIAHTIRSIAKYHVGLPEKELVPLSHITERLNRRVDGMTYRNQSRLAQFQDPRVLERFLALPLVEINKLNRAPTMTRNDAVKFSNLVALEILIHAPMRIGNLASLRTDVHVRMPRSGTGETVILLRRNEVKNDQPLQYILPAELTSLLQIYITRIKPLLEPDPSPFLFPGKAGCAKRSDGLSKQITTLVRDTMDIEFNPHLIRHLMAKLGVDARPGDYEGPRRLLGHTVKSLGTVTPISRPIATPLRLEIALFEDLREGWCRSCG